MFRFFNQAREVALSEGSTMRFLRYSLGEIVLVVIGILVALQINNWNYDPAGLEEVVVWNEDFTATDIERRLTTNYLVCANLPRKSRH